MANKTPDPTSQREQASQRKLAAAYRATYAVAALSLFLGILAVIFRSQAPGGIFLAIVCFAFGSLYALLGFFIQRKSAIALGISVALMLLNLISGLYNVVQTSSFTGLIIPIAFLSQTLPGFEAIQNLKKNSI
ncbi:hypothetical protein IQ249_24835 [Lusitaniella coriacea LEGE 07157]|uniref:Uncharacterized protein n=1 Tax=Lusitaniella coriacea LEGE 07157 TaxID=945747 RepID=A0A8J7IXY5_9CYAN|nr:hypothetical protein [Lusitaniella coriacea]MBE9119087.1 hypothetical protein [Lusitaniella coriacea LEGE 07157]